jgi:xylulokinase
VETNVRGAGILAAAALGYGRLEALADGVAVAEVHTPDPTRRRRYDTLFQEFLTIYRQNRRIYARLNRRAAKEGWTACRRPWTD